MGGTTAGHKQGTGTEDLAAMVVQATREYDGTALRYYDGDEILARAGRADRPDGVV